MPQTHAFRILACVVVGGALASHSAGQIDIGTTDASDGDLSGYNPTLNLAQAPTGVWDQPSIIPGKGVYDPIRWAVIYKFNNVSVDNLSIAPHPSGCPVVILCQGYFQFTGGIPVPPQVGGFPGGLNSLNAPGSAGLGLGGGQSSNLSTHSGGPGSYASIGTPPGSPPTFSPGDAYGNPAIIPLLGGSGGGSSTPAGWSIGGHGGGAILIAARNYVSLTGNLVADGNSPYPSAPGAGGAIRIIANQITGNGAQLILARGGSGAGGTGGMGRIRLEANTFGTWGSGQPSPSLATVGTTAKLWPDNNDPRVDVLSVNNIAAPLDPGAPFQSPDVQLNSVGSFTVVLQTRNVPTGGTWEVSVRGVPRSGAATVYPCTFVNGNQALANWSATIPFTEGLQVIQGRAKKTSGSRPGR